MADMKDKVKGAIDTGADKAKQGVDRAADAIHGARHDMGGATGGGMGTGGTSASGLADQARNVAQSAAGAATDLAHNVRDKASDYANQARDTVQNWAGDVSNTASQAGHRVQQWAGDAYDYSADHMKDFGQELTGMVRRYPIPAVLIGFGVGLLLGRAARA